MIHPGPKATRKRQRRPAALSVAAALGAVDREAQGALERDDPENVHRLRVAIRRFVEAGRQAEAPPGADTLRQTRRVLKDILEAAGPVRNADVARILISEEAPDRAAEWEPVLAHHQAEARRHLRVLLRRWIEHGTQRSLPASESQPAASTVRAVRAGLAGTGAKVFRIGGKAVRRRPSVRRLHRLRIAAKRFRYALEFYAPLLPASSAALADDMKKVQDWLGEANDCATVIEMAADWPGAGALRKALRKRRRRNIGEFSTYWEKRFGRRADRRRWIERLDPTSAL